MVVCRDSRGELNTKDAMEAKGRDELAIITLRIEYQPNLNFPACSSSFAPLVFNPDRS